MKRPNYKPFKFVNVAIAMVFALGYGLMNLHVFIKILPQQHSIFTLIDSFILAIVLIMSSSFMLRTLSCTMTVDDEKISQALFGKTRRTIRWEEIKEIGEGYVFTPDGKQKRIYISKEKLTPEEIDNLAIPHFKCIYFSGFYKEFAAELSKHIDYDLTPWIY